MGRPSTLRQLRSFASEMCREALEPVLYRIGLGAYVAGVRCAALRMPKARLLSRGQKELWKRLEEKIEPGARYVWIHAASLGEFEQGRPIIERLRREHPEYKVILTFFSPSGYEVRKDWPGADCVCYLPFDFPGNVKRFIRTVRPEMAIFVKYEIWRNYLRTLYKHGIPAYLISAVFRPEQAFFKKRSAWYRYWLRWYTRIFVQDARSRDLLESVSITNVEVAGDTRFDRVTDIMNTTRDIPALSRFREADGRPVLIAGSSWPADEEVYFPWLRHNRDRVKAVIAPHEFDAARLEDMRARLGTRSVLLSELEKEPALADSADCVIMDCFGLLSSAYRYGDVAYIGGGFGAGIHNINEAAVYGIPVVFGPRNSKFIEARELISCRGGFSVSGRDSLERTLTPMLDPDVRHDAGRRAARYIRSKLGATDRIFSRIFPKKK